MTCGTCANLREIETRDGGTLYACDTGMLVEADPGDAACSGYDGPEREIAREDGQPGWMTVWSVVEVADGRCGAPVVAYRSRELAELSAERRAAWADGGRYRTVALPVVLA